MRKDIVEKGWRYRKGETIIPLLSRLKRLILIQFCVQNLIYGLTTNSFRKRF